MSKMNIRFILKSGDAFTVECSEFSLKTNALGQPNGYEISGISRNKPVYIDFDCVAAIIREMENEKVEGKELWRN